MFKYVIKMKELRRNYMYHEQRQLLGVRELPVWQDVLQFPPNTDTLSTPIVATVVTESHASTAIATATTTTSKSTSVATAVPVSVSDSLKELKLKGVTEQVQNWTPCGVCSLDTTWSNVLKSDASRARCTHNCRSCGTVVCTVCSPSGDTLMGEGMIVKIIFIYFIIFANLKAIYSFVFICRFN
jgi:hypothetical protein